jgi:hypothetical protein
MQPLLSVGFGFIQHGHATLARGPEDFINVLHAMGVPTPFSAWLGMLEKVRMISGIRKQQPGLAGKPRKGPPDAKFQPIYLSASIARHSADGLRSGAYSLDAGSPRYDRSLA